MGRLISINDYGLSEKIVILSSTNPSKYGVRIALRGVYSSVFVPVLPARLLSLVCIFRRLSANNPLFGIVQHPLTCCVYR